MPTFTLEKFTPGEAERITGCAVSAQNSYRGRGLLPSNGGKTARFDVFGLAFLLFVRTMNERDLGFLAARALGPWVTDAIVRRVLRYGEAFDLAGLDADDGTSLDELAAGVMEAHSPSGAEKSAFDGGRFLIVWANNEPGFYTDVGPDLFEAEGAVNPRRVVGPVTTFDTLAGAAEIMARAGRPLVRVGAEALSFKVFSRPVMAH